MSLMTTTFNGQSQPVSRGRGRNRPTELEMQAQAIFNGTSLIQLKMRAQEAITDTRISVFGQTLRNAIADYERFPNPMFMQVIQNALMQLDANLARLQQQGL